MTRKGRVLFVEDLEKWQLLVANTLRRGGFHVEVAGTVDAALKHLDESFFHLAVLDINMTEDKENSEGMTLLRNIRERGLSDSLSVIMLSAYGTREQMREAFAQYKVTDFLSKDDFDNLEFLNQVRQIFDDFPLNLELTIHWQQLTGPEEAVLNLQLDGRRLKTEDPTHAIVAEELDDLLCRLYHKADSLIVKRLATGHSGAGLLWVQPFYKETGGAHASVLKFGDFREIAIEFSNFNSYVKSFISGGRNTTIQDPLGRTPRLGGITYSLLDAPGDQLASFGDFYHQSPVPAINSVMTRLFTETCGNWYANVGRLQPYNLKQDYEQLLGFTREKVERALDEKLKSVQGKLKLHFNALPGERSFTNPIYALEQNFVTSTYVCTTHGDFNESNILVDNTGHCWLIDFRRTGPGHILRDVAELESTVRLKLLGPDEATLEERLEMEEALCSIQHFNQLDELASSFKTENKALAKAFAASLHLRTLARKLVAQNPSDDISEYYVALFYYAVNMLRFYYLPTIQREHALLSASLLADKLSH